MKTITLETSTEKHMIQGREVELPFNDKSLIKEVVNTPIEGINIAQMRQRINLLDKLEKAGDKLELEDADFDAIKGLIENYKFGIVSRHVLALCEKFLNPEKQDGTL